MKSSMLLLPLILLAQNLAGEGPVRYLPDRKLWVLETDQASYVLGINERNEIQNEYWGKKLLRIQDILPAHTQDAFPFESREGNRDGNEAYPGWGGMRYAEPCLKVTLAGGVRAIPVS